MMKNKVLIRLAIVSALFANPMFATEWRTPYSGQQGPLRYTFEKNDDSKWSLNMYSATHIKEAHKAFMKHGIKTDQLTALYFNKADFSLNEIFPDTKVPNSVEEYSPFLKLMRYSPRANYMEYGMNVGGRFEYPV